MKKEKEENIWKSKIFCCCGEERQRKKRRKIFGEGHFLQRRKTKTEKEEKNLETENIFFAEQKTDGERKGGKYLEKENILLG